MQAAAAPPHGSTSKRGFQKLVRALKEPFPLNHETRSDWTASSVLNDSSMESSLFIVVTCAFQSNRKVVSSYPDVPLEPL